MALDVALAVALAMALDGEVRTGVHGADGSSLRRATEGEGGVSGIGSDVCDIILNFIFVNKTVKRKIGKWETENLRIGKWQKTKKQSPTVL